SWKRPIGATLSARGVPSQPWGRTARRGESGLAPPKKGSTHARDDCVPARRGRAGPRRLRRLEGRGYDDDRAAHGVETDADHPGNDDDARRADEDDRPDRSRQARRRRWPGPRTPAEGTEGSAARPVRAR